MERGVMEFRSLAQAYQQQNQVLELDVQDDIPKLVWLLENPQSPFSLPGKISLFDHDCLHVLLGLGTSPLEEAFIVGFSMGTDLQTSWLALQVFKLASRYFYPKKYKFSDQDFRVFEVGFTYGRNRPVKYLNLVNYSYWMKMGTKIETLRRLLDIDLVEIQSLIGCSMQKEVTQKAVGLAPP
jgi:hypothetical protein